MQLKIMRLNKSYLLLVFLLTSFTGGLIAQPHKTKLPLVNEIEVVFKGARKVSDQYIKNNLSIKKGMVYNQGLIDQSIRSLYKTGLFEFIEIDINTNADDSVKVTFLVRPKYELEKIHFTGNKKLKSTKLLNKIESVEGETLDEYKLKKDTDAIKEFYLEKGYSSIDVSYEITRFPENGKADVTFDVDEGKKITIKKVKLVGNYSVKSRKLLKSIETKKHNWLSWMTGNGKFNELTFRDDLDKLKDYYKNSGYLDVEIRESEVVFDYPRPEKLIISIYINEGQQYRVGDVSIVGNSLYTEEELKSVLRLNSGDIFSPRQVDFDQENLNDYYGKEGYLDTRVRPERKPNLSTRAIDLVYQVRESEKVYVESINLQGNTKTKSVVILRELALAPGDVFDLVRMKRSKNRLHNTRFFEEENLTPEPTNIPHRRNLRIAVKEKRTGNLTFGGGFSSLEQVVFFAEISQSNFDLFNWRSFFQGDGQKFRLRLQLGSKSSEAVLYFEEPWLFERQLALTFELFRKQSNFNSSLYDETRTGMNLGLRKRLFELVEGRINYGLESVDISDVDIEASSAIRSEEGSSTTSKIGLSLLRDTRDNLLFPTKGSRYEISSELAGGGLGGDNDYWKVELRGSNFFKTFDLLDQTASVIYRVGGITPYDDSVDVPFFDRFFLGGPNTLRGYDHRKVGPKDELNEPIGGDSFGMLSFEYTFKLAEPLRVAAFYDGGFVNSEDFDYSFDDYNDNWGFGARIMVMGAPLRLDLGFPLNAEEENDGGAQFYFSFGTRF